MLVAVWGTVFENGVAYVILCFFRIILTRRKQFQSLLKKVSVTAIMDIVDIAENLNNEKWHNPLRKQVNFAVIVK